MMPLSLAQWAGLAVLAGFGALFDLLVAWLQEHDAGDFTALQVIFGVTVTLVVQMLDSQGRQYTAGEWALLTLLHFAASGAPMTWGSLRRYADGQQAGRT